MSKPNILVCFYRYDKHNDKKPLKKKNGLSRLTAYSPLEREVSAETQSEQELGSKS